MTGLCVSGNPVSARDMSIKVTEHCPHLLWKRGRRHTHFQSVSHKRGPYNLLHFLVGVHLILKSSY